MANFIEYASKAQEELNRELQRLSEKEVKLAEQASLQAARSLTLDSREAEIAEKERLINEKKEELTLWEGRKLREEEVSRLHGEAMRKEEEASKKLKDAEEKLSETRMNLVELEKRELALSEREKSYREEVKKEIMNGFLGVK